MALHVQVQNKAYRIFGELTDLNELVLSTPSTVALTRTASRPASAVIMSSLVAAEAIPPAILCQPADGESGTRTT